LERISIAEVKRSKPPLRRPLPQLPHAQFPRQLIELHEQRRRQWYAVAQAFDAADAADDKGRPYRWASLQLAEATDWLHMSFPA